MAIFDRFNSQKHNNEQDGLMRELKKIYQKEGLPFDEVAWCKRHSKIPNVQLYTCKNKCPTLVYIGESPPSECPTCGNSYDLKRDCMRIVDGKEFRNLIASDGHFHYGLDCMKEGNLDLALAEFTRAIILRPDFVDAYYNRSAVRGMLDDPKGAIEDCGHVIRLNPKDEGAYFNRGTAKGQLGDFEGAVEDITRALTLGYSKPNAFLKRGMFMLQLGEIRKASADLNSFLDLDPHNKHCVYIRNLLSRLKEV